MSVYYVDFVNGLDANNGLGPDASHGSNKPWKTLAKLLGAAGMASGDTAYLSPAGPFREVVTVAMTSAVAETKIIGDPSNAQGFKTSGGVLVAPGPVIWTAYTTDDVTAPSTTALLTPAARDFLTFENIIMVGGSNATAGILIAAAGSTNLIFTNCTWIQSRTDAAMTNLTGTVDVAWNWTFDRCIFLSGSSRVLDFVLPTSASADYDCAVLIQNCLAITHGGTFVRVNSSGANSFKAGGIDVLNCTCIGTTVFLTISANLSTSIPCTVLNSAVVLATTGVSANTAGQITEDYCYLLSTTARTNVTAGANSTATSAGVIAKAPLLECGQALQQGFGQRPFGAPTVGSPFLNFGSSGAPAVDLLNRARPAGSGLGAAAGVSVAVGALERHDTAAQETSTVDVAASGLKIVGPGDHDIRIPVDASATVITIRARYDTTHDTTNKPQAILQANAKIGVTTETVTMTAAADTWETLTFASQTPSAKGVVTVRLVSRSAAGTGIAFFDTLVVS